MNKEKPDKDMAPTGKNTQQDLLSELNDVLSIRAEKIRQRLVSEREGESDDILVSTDYTKPHDEVHSKESR